jgi:hypothetical protein
MPRRNARPRHRKGALSEVELDGSVTLYGLEDWTQVRDDSVVEIVQHTEPDDPTDAADEGGVST